MFGPKKKEEARNTATDCKPTMFLPDAAIVDFINDSHRKGVEKGREMERDHIEATAKMEKAKADFIAGLPDFGPKSGVCCPKCGGKSWGAVKLCARKFIVVQPDYDCLRQTRNDLADCGSVEYLSLTCACGHMTTMKTKDFEGAGNDTR